MSGAFTIGDARSYEQDPRFGLIVLAEVASRALSPGVNDPGTAIDVIGTAVRLLHEWCRPVEDDEEGKIEYPRIFVPQLNERHLIEDIFTPIARDGAALAEVGIRLQKALRAVAAMPSQDLRVAAAGQALEARERGEKALSHPRDLARLRAAASWIPG